MRSKTILFCIVSALAIIGAAGLLYAFWIAPFRMLIDEGNRPRSDVTLWATAVGCHWRYTYETPQGRVVVDPAEPPCTTRECRLGFDARRAMVVPVGKTVTLTVASLADAPRDLQVPTLGIRVEALPGAIRESHFTALREGHFVGTASKACANDPASIPVGIRAVDAQSWDAYLAHLAEKVTRE